VYREERTAKNESLFREVNERIGEAAHRTVAIATDADFVCECASLECTERITIGLDEYEWVRSEPKRFMLVAGHEQADIEQIVTRRNGYVVVEKVGEAGEEAEDRDPT
jgi:inactivated superfamily I helicase